MVRTIGATKFARRSNKAFGSSANQGNMQGKGATDRGEPKRSYLLAGIVIIVGAYTLKMFSNPLRPFRIKTTRGGLSFKNWLRSNFDVAKEDFQDVFAEASYGYEKEKEGNIIHFNKEQELVEKLDTYIETLEKKLKKDKKAGVS